MIIGHEEIRSRLRLLASHQEMAATFLFSGPEGVGKSLVAHEWAREILCARSTGCEPGNPCLSCAILLDRKKPHPDIVLLSPGSKGGKQEEDSDSIKIDQARAFMIELSSSPLYSTRKAAIIDQAHLLTNQAANSLLKTLEEPPPGVVIILVTHLPDRLPQTIRSRCLSVSFASLSLPDFIEVLSQKKEKFPLSPEDLYSLTQGAPGQVPQQISPGRIASLKAARRLFSPDRKSLQSLYADLAILLDDPDESFFLNRLEHYLLDLYRQELESPGNPGNPIKRQGLHDKLYRLRSLSVYNIHRAMNAEEALLEFGETFGA